MSTTTNLSTLKINYLTQSQYDTALDNNQINENEIYLTPTEDMTAQEIEDFVSELNVGDNNGTAVDLVVEQGTSGIWTYRKWNSGIAECWGTYIINYTSMTAWGSMYYSQPYATISFPTGLFIDVPTANLTRTQGVEGWVGNTTTTKDQVTNVYIVRPTTASANASYISISARGRWK